MGFLRPVIDRLRGGETAREIKRLRRRIKALERKYAEQAAWRAEVAENWKAAAERQQALNRNAALAVERVTALTGRPLAHQVLMYGLQGSGNVIAQHIFKTILGEPANLPLLRNEAAAVHAQVGTTFRALGEALAVDSCMGPGHGRPWELNGVMATQGDSVVFPCIPSPEALSRNVYGTHTLPERCDIEQFKNCGGKVVVILRHPLDVTASCATKSVPHDAGDRKLRRDRLLADPAFISTFTWQIEAWWLRFSEIADMVTVIRYEDIIGDPRTFVEKSEDLLDKNIPSEIAADLAEKVGTADLSVKGHRFEAKAGGWIGSLGEMALPYFERIRPFAAAYGYEWPAAGSYSRPEITRGFGVVGYCFRHPSVQAYLQENQFLHESHGLSFVCAHDSSWIANLDNVLRKNMEMVEKLTGHRPPVPWNFG